MANDFRYCIKTHILLRWSAVVGDWSFPSIALESNVMNFWFPELSEDLFRKAWNLPELSWFS